MWGWMRAVALGLQIEGEWLVGVILEGRPETPLVLAVAKRRADDLDAAVGAFVAIAAAAGETILRAGLVLGSTPNDRRTEIAIACADHGFPTTGQHLASLRDFATRYFSCTAARVDTELRARAATEPTWGTPEDEATLAGLAALDVACMEVERGIKPIAILWSPPRS